MPADAPATESPFANAPFQDRAVPLASVPQDENVDVPSEEKPDVRVFGLVGSVLVSVVSVGRSAFGSAGELHFAAKGELPIPLEKAKVFPLPSSFAGSVALDSRFREWKRR